MSKIDLQPIRQMTIDLVSEMGAVVRDYACRYLPSWDNLSQQALGHGHDCGFLGRECLNPPREKINHN